MLYLIVGASGTGKDYIVDKLCKELKMQKVISRTERPRRKSEVGTHLFVDSDTADKEFDKAIAKTVYRGNRYYTLQEDLEGKDFYIIDVAGVYSMRKKGMLFTTIFINSKWYIRFWHMLKRGDKVKDIIKRLRYDKKEFANFQGDVNLKSSDELYDYIKERKICN